MREKRPVKRYFGDPAQAPATPHTHSRSAVAGADLGFTREPPS